MLDDPTIQRLKADAKPRKYADGGGLFLFIPVTGKKLWRMAYRFEHKAKLLTFGEYPQVPLGVARQRRDEAKALLKEGIDPATRKAAPNPPKPDISFRAVACEWLEREAAYCQRKYRFFIANNLEKYFFPLFGDKPMPELQAQDIMDAIAPFMESGKLRGGRRLTDVCGQICRYAVIQGKAERDITEDLPVPYRSKQAGHRAATLDAVKLGQIMTNLEQHDGYFPVKCALRLVPLLLVRSGELRCAEWTEFNLGKKIWVIPRGRAKRGFDHFVPLAPQAVKILKELRCYSGNGKLLFPSVKNPGQPIDISTITVSLRRRGYDGVKLSFDGIRALATRIFMERGYSPQIIRTQMAHRERKDAKTQFEPKQFLAERQTMMNEWADYLYSQMDENVATKPSGEVISC